MADQSIRQTHVFLIDQSVFQQGCPCFFLFVKFCCHNKPTRCIFHTHDRSFLCLDPIRCLKASGHSNCRFNNIAEVHIRLNFRNFHMIPWAYQIGTFHFKLFSAHTDLILPFFRMQFAFLSILTHHFGFFQSFSFVHVPAFRIQCIIPKKVYIMFLCKPRFH